MHEEAQHVEQLSVALYRHYDVDGAVLYVGISSCPFTRTTAHKSTSPWFGCVRRIEIEWHATRWDALDAEAWSIFNESPRENRSTGQERFSRLVCWLARDASVEREGVIPNMETPRTLIDRLGRDAIAARLDIAPRRVSNAALDAQLPASWYVTLSDMAGGDLPREMFTFKGMAQEAAE